MSSLRDDLLPLFADVRGLMGPDGFDFRRTQVTIRTRTFDDGFRSSEGAYGDADLELPQHFRVRQATQREVLASNGRFKDDDVIVGPITPRDAADTVGFTEAELAPDGGEGVEVVYILSGGITGEYTRVSVDADANFGIFLHLTRKRTTP